MCDSMRTLTFSTLFQFVRCPPLSAEMRIGVPIILFVAVAGFHSVISASLQCDERTKLPEDRAFEENSTTPQADKPEYEAAHVKDGETKAVTDTTEEDDDEDSEEKKLLEKKDSDDEREALTDATGANTGSDETIDSDSEDDTSQQKTEHSEQAEANVKSFEDFSDEEYGRYYDY
ncbi:nucleolar transcription factor 1-B isoform X1 [Labeo rohita]|uniref:nucleolar transcription factor 1-B isoform X1 n=1 Tax=Labeo rohita TaxID=84645 RepID=UPI0021E215E8|nr:nucleolar transcription factor 1-B isoform X1 [Labeo rohita]